MFDRLLANFSKHIQLSADEEAQVTATFQQRNVAKGEYLVEQGKICRSLYFVDGGCLRTFYLDATGTETNILLHPENWWAGDLASFAQHKKATFSITALELTQVSYINTQDLEDLFIAIPKLERFFRILYQNGFNFYQNRLVNFLTKSAEERYRIFKKVYPGMELRIPQKHIASFLGMTPVFLSILRKRQVKSGKATR